LALFLYSLTKKGASKFAEVAGDLGVDIKRLEQEAEQQDRQMERPKVHYAPKEPNPNAPMETTQEIGQLIRIPSKWRKRPG
jgi:hypothetical protein